MEARQGSPVESPRGALPESGSVSRTRSQLQTSAPNYVPLWCKSNYSFLEGASHPEELVERASKFALPAIAITDRNGVYGIVRAHERAKSLGFPLIIGAQLSVSPETNFVMLAQNREGYATLCRLISLGHLDQTKGSFALSWDQVANHSQGLIGLWSPSAFGVPREAELSTLKDAFGDRLYAMVCRHRWIYDVLLEKETLEHCRRFDISPIATTEVLYHSSERQQLQDVVTCIGRKVRLADAGTKIKPNAEHAIKSPQEFLSVYADVPQWVSRTIEVSERCQFSLSEIEYRYPEEGVPEGFTTAAWLRQLTFEGAGFRYNGEIPERVTAQLKKELKLIEELRYSGYFLTMWELVQFCKKEGILCQGRGSAANSAVCYCLGVTAIDPVRMNLLFERFLSLERAEPPDIDLDIEHHRREEVIQHVYQKYGRKRAAMVANVVRYRSRSALREVGKVLGMSEVDLDRSSKLLSHHDEGLEGALRDAGHDPAVPIFQKLTTLANQLRGFPRHLSIHPGGFLLGSEPISRIVPIENATMPGRTVIQWDKVDVEAMNLFKVDLLGLGALTHLDYAFQLLKKHRGIDLSMATIPPDDTAVFDMACKADTVGVFQIESRAQMSMLPRLKPRTYYDLVIEVSLVRPGPITGGMVHPYLARRAGKEAVTYPHESLEPVLSKTLGIPLFQEQVMKLAMVAADYTPGESDQLRRDMAAWKQSGRIEQHRDKLVGRMVAKGIEQEFAERVFDQIRGFGEYGFPESHAASFALIAYATAYVKCHHPEVFACALLNAWPMGFYAPGTIIGDAKRHGVQILPADVWHSEWDCTLEMGQRNTEELAVRVGLRYIKGLARAEAQKVLDTRPSTPNTSITAWKAKCPVSTDTWEKLAVSGAMGQFGRNRRDALWQVLDHGSSVPLGFDEPTSARFDELSSSEAVAWDYSAMGHSPQAHILEQIRPQLESEKFATAAEISHAALPRYVTYAGLVICRQMPSNAKGVLFMTLEDETGTVNVVVWKKVWDQFRKTILTSAFLAVAGRLQSEEGVVHLMADRIWCPEGGLKPSETPHQSHDFR